MEMESGEMKMKVKGKNWKNRIAPYIGVAILGILWFAVCEAGVFNAYVLPSPGKVFQSFWKMLLSGELFIDIAISFGRVFKGFVIAFLLAFALGMFRMLIPASEKYFDLIVQFFKTHEEQMNIS